MHTLLPFVTLSLLALGCQSQGPAPLVIEHGTTTTGATVRVVARISSYAPNAIEDYYGDSRPPEFFDSLTLTLLSPAPFAKRVLRVGITKAQKQFWQCRRGIVEFTISRSDLSNALKPDSSHQLFDGALHGVSFRPCAFETRRLTMRCSERRRAVAVAIGASRGRRR